MSFTSALRSARLLARMSGQTHAIEVDACGSYHAWRAAFLLRDHALGYEVLPVVATIEADGAVTYTEGYELLEDYALEVA